MLTGPRAERLYGLPQGTAELRQLVVHALWSGREHRSRHQAISLQSPQREGQHPLRNAADHPLHLVEAHWAITEQYDDEHGPLVPYPRQDGAEGAAILGVRIG